ncbi:unnamed protein product [Calypogeia fissa]
MPHYALSDEFRKQLKMKCLDSLIPKAKAGDVVVPAYTGNEQKSESVSWLTLFCQWALQQGMSADHTLEMATAHMKYSLAQKMPRVATWAEFIHQFFILNDLHVDGESRFRQWYYTRAANIRFTWFSHRELRAATHNFSDLKAVHDGKVGMLYEGCLPDGQAVVVKKFKDKQGHSLEEILYEVFLHRSLPKSSHFVKLLGYCSNEHDPLLVYEYVSKGNLEQHLQGHFPKRLAWDDRLAIAIDVADAITQLHYNSKFPIYHRDVTSTNILLDQQRRAKLADFGIAAAVSHEKHRSYCHTKVKGSRGYTDPHYESTGKLTDTTDVYSFGVLLMELVTALKVGLESRTKTFLPDLVMEMSSLGLVDDIVDSSIFCLSGSKDEVPCKECLRTLLEELIDVAIKCCTPDPTKRPKINEVADQLKRLQLEHCMRSSHVDSKRVGKDSKERREVERYAVTSCSGVASVRYLSPLLKLVQNFFRLVVSNLRPYTLCQKDIGVCNGTRRDSA